MNNDLKKVALAIKKDPEIVTRVVQSLYEDFIIHGSHERLGKEMMQFGLIIRQAGLINNNGGVQ
jgi:hypothetical protein